ncbi:uncharacterized protein [Clytia hemisphaerica]|uniref:uncharacterized protein n=1 Tax=Clytia hemisphaerica TaxID=252671 RepID=UPI0034D550E3
MQHLILMKPKQKPYRIDCLAGYQGSRPSEGNQSGVEKSATGIQSSQNDPQGHQNRETTNSDPVVIEPKNKPKRQKWTIEDYKNVIRAFTIAQENPIDTITRQTYTEWREIVGEVFRPTIDANKLANVRRDILNKKRLNDAQLDQIRSEILAFLPSESEETTCEEGTTDMSPSVSLHNLNEREINEIMERVRNPEQETFDFIVERAEEELNDLFVEEHKEEIAEARDDIIREFSRVNSIDFTDRENLPKLQFTLKNNTRVRIYDSALKILLSEVDMDELDLSQLNDLIYATAKSTTTSVGVKIKKTNKRTHVHKAPRWKRKLQLEIDSLRADISILDELVRGVEVKTRRARKLKRALQIKDETSLLCAKENLMQKMQLKAQRMRRFDKRTKFFRQNKVFSTDAKKFYREIGKGKISVEEPPSQEDIEGFWNNIWGKKKSYNREATWIEREEERMKGKKEQEWEEITVEEVRVALGKTQKWKSPGIDKVQNFWLNYLPSMHRALTFFLNELVGNPNSIPEWLTEGVTYLLPKSEDTKNPNNYRPITCLNTIYKLLTSVLTERMYSFLEDNSILPTEQKGCKRNSYGCKDQLLIDRMILESCRAKNKNLSTAWIDYRKAFDSVPHDWILENPRSLQSFPNYHQFSENSYDAMGNSPLSFSSARYY